LKPRTSDHDLILTRNSRRESSVSRDGGTDGGAVPKVGLKKVWRSRIVSTGGIHMPAMQSSVNVLWRTMKLKILVKHCVRACDMI